jgi:hypothetical protein
MKFKYTMLPVDFLRRMQCLWLFGFGHDYIPSIIKLEKPRYTEIN